MFPKLQKLSFFVAEIPRMPINQMSADAGDDGGQPDTDNPKGKTNQIAFSQLFFVFLLHFVCRQLVVCVEIAVVLQPNETFGFC